MVGYNTLFYRNQLGFKLLRVITSKVWSKLRGDQFKLRLAQVLSCTELELQGVN